LLICSFQMTNTKMTKRDTEKPFTTVMATYFSVYSRFLDTSFNGLETTHDWEKFYVYLVKKSIRMTKMVTDKRNTDIDWKKIVFPNVPDLFQVCRLLFQANVDVRIGIIDGQHRICAMMQLLTGWSIEIQANSIPPKVFKRQPHLKQSMETERNEFDQLLSTMTSTLVSVRTLVAESTREMEDYAVAYSKAREDSQSKKKPRVLMDV
jgi:hypothetical protein